MKTRFYESADYLRLYPDLNSFRFIRLRLTLSATETLHLPSYKGSTVRGGLGVALKRTVCLMKDQNCAGCIIKDKCAYSYIFETPRSATGGAEWEASHDPHPFVLVPPLETKTEYLPGASISLALILIGKGSSYLPYLILAFEELGRIDIGKEKGRFQLVKVENLSHSPENQGEPVYDGDSGVLRRQHMRESTFSDILKQVKQLSNHSITLRFVTPTRIRHNGELTKYMDFEVFIRNLLRRLSWLSELYCSEKWDLDYAALLARARESVKCSSSYLHWCDLERYSARQNTRLKMGGFMGSLTFEGELGEFLPFIKLGEYLHIGKGTAYGLGKYLIESNQII